MKKSKDKVKIVIMHHTGTTTFERVRGFFENIYNILTVNNKKVQVDLKIVDGKRLSIEEIVNNYSQFGDE